VLFLLLLVFCFCFWGFDCILGLFRRWEGTVGAVERSVGLLVFGVLFGVPLGVGPRSDGDLVNPVREELGGSIPNPFFGRETLVSSERL
jgi:hypothetical protein